jgi:hypothetical protein
VLADDVMAELDQEEESVFFLTAKVEKAGGSYRIRRNLVQMLTRRDPLTFSGGVVVSFALLDRQGDFVTAATLRERKAFSNFAASGTTFGQARMSRP